MSVAGVGAPDVLPSTATPGGARARMEARRRTRSRRQSSLQAMPRTPAEKPNTLAYQSAVHTQLAATLMGERTSPCALSFAPLWTPPAMANRSAAQTATRAGAVVHSLQQRAKQAEERAAAMIARSASLRHSVAPLVIEPPTSRPNSMDIHSEAGRISEPPGSAPTLPHGIHRDFGKQKRRDRAVLSTQIPPLGLALSPANSRGPPSTTCGQDGDSGARAHRTDLRNMATESGEGGGSPDSPVFDSVGEFVVSQRPSNGAVAGTTPIGNRISRAKDLLFRMDERESVSVENVLKTQLFELKEAQKIYNVLIDRRNALVQSGRSSNQNFKELQEMIGSMSHEISLLRNQIENVARSLRSGGSSKSAMEFAVRMSSDDERIPAGNSAATPPGRKTPVQVRNGHQSSSIASSPPRASWAKSQENATALRAAQPTIPHASRPATPCRKPRALGAENVAREVHARAPTKTPPNFLDTDSLRRPPPQVQLPNGTALRRRSNNVGPSFENHMWSVERQPDVTDMSKQQIADLQAQLADLKQQQSLMHEFITNVHGKAPSTPHKSSREVRSHTGEQQQQTSSDQLKAVEVQALERVARMQAAAEEEATLKTKLLASLEDKQREVERLKESYASEQAGLRAQLEAESLANFEKTRCELEE
eukprot:SAG31_NODE_5588_length_2439_cov_1.964530_2_plen_650_part_01